MRTSLARRQAALDNILANLNSGTIKIYSGARPTDSDTALSGNTLLSTLGFGSTAFAATGAGGVATANAIASDTNAAATGTASFARLFKSDGTTAVADVSVGTSGAELTLSTLSVVAGGTLACSSCTITFPVGS